MFCRYLLVEFLCQKSAPAVGCPLQEFLLLEPVYNIDLSIKYEERLNKLLDENPQEPVEFEL